MTVLNTSAISTKLIFLIVGKHISKLNVQMMSYKSKECESLMDLFLKNHFVTVLVLYQSIVSRSNVLSHTS